MHPAPATAASLLARGPVDCAWPPPARHGKGLPPTLRESPSAPCSITCSRSIWRPSSSTPRLMDATSRASSSKSSVGFCAAGFGRTDFCACAAPRVGTSMQSPSRPRGEGYAHRCRIANSKRWALATTRVRRRRGLALGPTTGFDELALRSEVGGSSDSQGLGAALVHHSPGTRA